MIASMSGCELERVIAAQMALLSPEVRTARDRLEVLLADDFVEVGASGRRWERDAIVADRFGIADRRSDRRGDGRSPHRQADRVGDLRDGEQRSSGTPQFVVARESWNWRCFFHQASVAPSGE